MAIINFGDIKESILIDLTESYLSKKEEYDNIIDGYIGIVNESKVLKLLNETYDKLTNKTIESDNLATRYVDNIVRLFESITLNEYNREIKKLEIFVNENNIKINTNKLNEDITVLIKNTLKSNKTPNVDKLHESFVNVLENVKTKKTINESNEKQYDVLNENVLKIAISNYNKKYSDLSESDNRVLKILIENNHANKLDLLEELKTENIRIINEINEDNVKIEMAVDKINKMPISEKEINESIITMYDFNCELKNS